MKTLLNTLVPSWQTGLAHAVPTRKREPLVAGLLLAGAWMLAIRQLSLEWSVNPQYQYGWIVPVLALLLWWRAWGSRPEPGEPVAGAVLPLLFILMALLAFPLRVIAEANGGWRALNDYFGLQAILVTALVIDRSGGTPWLRHFAFPLLFPLVSIPWPTYLEDAVIQGLQRYVAALGVEGASWVGWSALQQGNLIVLSQGVVGIDEACSGIRSLQSSLMISLFLGAFFQLSTARRWLLVALALFFAFALNVCRAFLLIGVVEQYGIDTMLKFHDPAGFTIAMWTLVLLWVSANLLAGPTNPAPRASSPQTRGFRFPLRWGVVLLVAWLGAELFNQGWYLWRERTTVPAPIWTIRRPFPRSGVQDVELGDTIQNTLRYTTGFHGVWKDQYDWELFFFTWKPNRVSALLAELHNPYICLPGAGFDMKANLGETEMDINGVPLPVHTYIFQIHSTGQLLYVFQAVTEDRVWKGETAGPVLNINSSDRLETAWEGRRNPGQRSLLVASRGAASLEQAEQALRDLLKDSIIVLPAK